MTRHRCGSHQRGKPTNDIRTSNPRLWVPDASPVHACTSHRLRMSPVGTSQQHIKPSFRRVCSKTQGEMGSVDSCQAERQSEYACVPRSPTRTPAFPKPRRDTHPLHSFISAASPTKIRWSTGRRSMTVSAMFIRKADTSRVSRYVVAYLSHYFLSIYSVAFPAHSFSYFRFRPLDSYQAFLGAEQFTRFRPLMLLFSQQL